MKKIDVHNYINNLREDYESDPKRSINYLLDIIRGTLVNKNNLITEVESLTESNRRLKRYYENTKDLKKSLDKLTAEKSKWLRNKGI